MVLLTVAGAIILLGTLVPPVERRAADEAGLPTGELTPTAPVGAAVPTATPTQAAPTAPATPTQAASTAPAAAPPVLRLTGSVPSVGPATFAYGASRGEVLGRAGLLRRYRVAVETGAGEDIEEFGAAVDLALGDPASWIGSGQLRFQRVPDRVGHDFTIYLATAGTAQRMCVAGGVNIRIDGRPYTSCRATGKVIINLDRWRLSVDHFVAAKVPLDVYRIYVVNHEVGHELGHRHERCPGAGRQAPVMMQQTLFLRGCVANPWPYLRGRRYAGPAL